MTPAQRQRIRQILPLLGTVLLLGLFFGTTDRAKLMQALAMANLGQFFAVILITTVVTWLYDSFCLVWLVRVTLGHRGKPEGATLREIAPVKAASYLLNVVNYHAANLAMGWLIGRRKGVPFLEAGAALATLSWLDLVTVTGMAVIGLWLAPEVLGNAGSLQIWLQIVAGCVFGSAFALMLLLQSPLQISWLQRLRQLAPIRPLVRLGPWQMLQGLALRSGLIAAYTIAAVLVMRSFGMAPQWGKMFVCLPVLTVVGTIPISVSGLGTTQALMRTLYAPFVIDGRAATPVIDAYSSAQIVGYIVLRLLLAMPFLRKISQELRQRPTSESALPSDPV